MVQGGRVGRGRRVAGVAQGGPGCWAWPRASLRELLRVVSHAVTSGCGSARPTVCPRAADLRNGRRRRRWGAALAAGCRAGWEPDHRGCRTLLVILGSFLASARQQRPHRAARSRKRRMAASPGNSGVLQRRDRRPIRGQGTTGPRPAHAGGLLGVLRPC